MNNLFNAQANTVAAVTDALFGRAHRKQNEYEMLNVVGYIHQADLVQCKSIVDALVERVSSLIGEARELEDASCVIAREIECGQREAA